MFPCCLNLILRSKFRRQNWMKYVPQKSVFFLHFPNQEQWFDALFLIHTTQISIKANEYFFIKTVSKGFLLLKLLLWCLRYCYIQYIRLCMRCCSNNICSRLPPVIEYVMVGNFVEKHPKGPFNFLFCHYPRNPFDLLAFWVEL